jgi:hypothetical protein
MEFEVEVARPIHNSGLPGVGFATPDYQVE